MSYLFYSVFIPGEFTVSGQMAVWEEAAGETPVFNFLARLESSSRASSACSMIRGSWDSTANVGLLAGRWGEWQAAGWEGGERQTDSSTEPVELLTLGNSAHSCHPVRVRRAPMSPLQRLPCSRCNWWGQQSWDSSGVPLFPMGNRILYYQRFLYDLPSQGFGAALVTFVSASWLSSVQWLSCVRLFGTPWTAACQASLSITNSQSLLKLMSIESVMPSNHLILCQPLFLLPSIFPSIRVFSNKSVLHIRWPKYWSFSFSISLSNEYSGLISFRIYWFDLLAVQEPLKSLPQHHSSKVSILQHSDFFMVQLSHPYITNC